MFLVQSSNKHEKLLPPCRWAVSSHLSKDQSWPGLGTFQILWWSRCPLLLLLFLPFHLLLVQVVTKLLDLVETQLMEDKDKKLIMTLINIEHMRVNDFFFGIHCLLSLVRGFQLSNLQFSRRLWFVLLFLLLFSSSLFSCFVRIVFLLEVCCSCSFLSAGSVCGNMEK